MRSVGVSANLTHLGRFVRLLAGVNREMSHCGNSGLRIEAWGTHFDHSNLGYPPPGDLRNG
jgi:hypothetical protein